jgi:dimethylamine/trimethylamine dehydrogenase
VCSHPSRDALKGSRVLEAPSPYDILFEPVQLGPKTAPNRFWQTPHASGFGTDFASSQAAYRGIKAEGGWGVIFTEATSISAETDKTPTIFSRMWDEGDILNSRVITDRIHAHGALAGTELEYHPSTTYGVESRTNGRGVVPLASESYLPVAYATTMTEILDQQDIDRIQELHVKAALRAVDAGFDLLTFHFGHASSMLATFLIPYYNTRTDHYGGSLENRLRFTRETLTKVRAAVGDRAAVGLRFGVDTLDAPIGLGDRGVRTDGEAPLVMQLLDDLVDYWDLVIGGSDWGQDAQSSRTAVENHEAPFTGGMKKYTTKPVVNVGRFNSPDTMVNVVKNGQCDLIGAARATISDPFLPHKIKSGRIEDIRECIGCNMCVSRIEMSNGRIICTQNATVGEEWRRSWHPEVFTTAANADKSVLIVGAGPAGLECATILGRRGMEAVHLVDSRAEVGGSLTWITRIPGRREWRHVIEYREHQLSKLKNVQVILNTPLTAEDVLEYGAEIVVVAAGSHYTLDSVSPYDRTPQTFLRAFGDRLLAPEDVLDRGREVGDRVVIIDTDGYFVGVGLAELLVEQGRDVTIVTPATVVAAYMEKTLEHRRLMLDLVRLGVHLMTSTTAVGATGDAVEVVAFDGTRSTIPADAVILVGQREADSGLYKELMAAQDRWTEAGIDAVYRIGDCERPSFIADAIFSGHRLAREIDSEDPTQPLPFARDRRVVGAAEGDYTVGGRLSLPRY